MKSLFVCHLCLRPVGYLSNSSGVIATCMKCAEADDEVPKWRPKLVADNTDPTARPKQEDAP